MNKIALSILIACCFLVYNSYSQPSGLFDSDEILEFTLRGDLKKVFKDRGDDSQYNPASISIKDENNEFNIPLKIKTRGHFRKMAANCKYPPILLNFAKASTPEDCIFQGQDKLKLVTPCKGDNYVIHEYLVYKLYNLITPRSFRARLVKVVYQDTVKNKSTEPLYGMLLEDEDQMAIRNNSKSMKRDGLLPQALDSVEFKRMAVFQYMIGNTDWSVQYRQNIKLIFPESTSLLTPVPYDFDHAGIVRAPYANPAPELQMESTLERRYRGYCIEEMSEYDEVFELFNQLKDDFYAVYESNPLLHKSYIKQTTGFLNKFYLTINDPKRAKKAFNYPCLKTGTGNVVIKGLRK